MRAALAWFRRDLPVHDHPPLRAALAACERIVPVFVLDDRLLGGPRDTLDPIVDHAVERERPLQAYGRARTT